MSWNTGIPQPYHTSEVALPNTGSLAVRRLDLTAIRAASLPSNLTASANDARGYAGSAKTGLVWICFSNDESDDANPAETPILSDKTANRYQDLMPIWNPFEVNSKQYMSVFDPDGDTSFFVRHCY